MKLDPIDLLIHLTTDEVGKYHRLMVAIKNSLATIEQLEAKVAAAIEVTKQGTSPKNQESREVEGIQQTAPVTFAGSIKKEGNADQSGINSPTPEKVFAEVVKDHPKSEPATCHSLWHYCESTHRTHFCPNCGATNQE